MSSNDHWRLRGRWAFYAFGVIAGAYLIVEHRAHLTGALPFLIILACPLLHMLMHGGHGGHGRHGERRERGDPGAEER